MKTLLLSEKDIQPLLSMKEVMKAVESAFKEKSLGHVEMPAKSYLFYSKHNGDLRAMPAYLKRLDISAVKVVNVHPDNKVKHKLPTVMATIIMIDTKTGFPLAIMGGTSITNIRTGAAGGVAAKYLAKRGSKTIGIIGAGAQARTQLMALKEVFKEIETVKVTDIIKSARDKYAEEMTVKLGLNVRAVDNVEEAVEGVDVAVTVTPARTPIIKNEWIETGVHINAIGADAPGKEELDPDILKRAKIVVDDREQTSHCGEINVPLAKGIITKENIWCELGEVVAGLKQGRTSSDEVTVFDSTGIAILDAVAADLVYKKALTKGIGQLIDII